MRISLSIRQLRQERDARIAAALRSNPKISLRAVARQYGVSYGTAHAVAKKHGLLRPPGHQSGTPNRTPKAKDQKITAVGGTSPLPKDQKITELMPVTDVEDELAEMEEEDIKVYGDIRAPEEPTRFERYKDWRERKKSQGVWLCRADYYSTRKGAARLRLRALRELTGKTARQRQQEDREYAALPPFKPVPLDPAIYKIDEDDLLVEQVANANTDPRRPNRPSEDEIEWWIANYKRTGSL